MDIDKPPLTANEHGYRKPNNLSEQLPSYALYPDFSCDQDELYLRYRASSAVVYDISLIGETYMEVYFNKRQVVQVKCSRAH